MSINREDMLELTRRMTVKRSCFSRIAGAYLDAEGYVDGTFNQHFLKLSLKDQGKNIELAKKIPFAETNVNLKEYVFPPKSRKPGSMWHFLMGLKDSELKNDGMLDIFYEVLGEKYCASGEYAVYFFFGSYDVPRKGADQAEQWESEEVYKFLVCTICPVSGDYEPGEPECGFLFPAFKDRSSDSDRINMYWKDAGNPHEELKRFILGK